MEYMKRPKNREVKQSPSLMQKRGGKRLVGLAGDLLPGAFLLEQSPTQLEKKKKQEEILDRQAEQKLINVLSKDVGHDTIGTRIKNKILASPDKVAGLLGHTGTILERKRVINS